jgi:hypothetical protein
MSKGLPVTMVRVYEGMLYDIMKPITDKVEMEKRAFIKLETISIIKRWGLADKVARLALLEAETKQLKEELEEFLGRYHDGGDVRREAMRLANENITFRVFDDAINAYLKVIRLSSAPQEVREVFEKLDADMKDWQRLSGKISYSKALEKSKDTDLIDKLRD